MTFKSNRPRTYADFEYYPAKKKSPICGLILFHKEILAPDNIETLRTEGFTLLTLTDSESLISSFITKHLGENILEDFKDKPTVYLSGDAKNNPVVKRSEQNLFKNFFEVNLPREFFEKEIFVSYLKDLISLS